MTTIAQAATTLNVSPKKLVNELKKKFPQEVWTPDSELPSGFLEAAQAHAEEYAQASGVELPKGELTTSQECVLDNKIILESLEYGVLEAIATMRTAQVTESAQLDAISDIQQYETAYNQIWASYFQKKTLTTDQQRQARNQAKAKQLINLNNTLGNRQGELIRTQEQIRNSQAKAQQQTQTVLDALLK